MHEAQQDMHTRIAPPRSSWRIFPYKMWQDILGINLFQVRLFIRYCGNSNVPQTGMISSPTASCVPYTTDLHWQNMGI